MKTNAKRGARRNCFGFFFLFQQAINYHSSMSIGQIHSIEEMRGSFHRTSFWSRLLQQSMATRLNRLSVCVCVFFIRLPLILFYFEYDWLHRPHVDTITNRPVAVTHATTRATKLRAHTYTWSVTQIITVILFGIKYSWQSEEEEDKKTHTHTRSEQTVLPGIVSLDLYSVDVFWCTQHVDVKCREHNIKITIIIIIINISYPAKMCST